MSERTIDGPDERPNNHARGPTAEPRSIAEIVQRIAADARVLARDELALAKHELTQAGERSVLSVGAIVLSGVLGLISLGLLCMTVVVALAPLVPALWLRMLIMSLTYLCLGTLLGSIFVVRLRQLPFGLPQTRQEAKATVEAVREEVRHD